MDAHLYANTLATRAGTTCDGVAGVPMHVLLDCAIWPDAGNINSMNLLDRIGNADRIVTWTSIAGRTSRHILQTTAERCLGGAAFSHGGRLLNNSTRGLIGGHPTPATTEGHWVVGDVPSAYVMTCGWSPFGPTHCTATHNLIRRLHPVALDADIIYRTRLTTPPPLCNTAIRIAASASLTPLSTDSVSVSSSRKSSYSTIVGARALP